MAETAKKTAAKKTAASEKPTGLDNTGNPADLSTRPEGSTSSDIGHQEGAPEALTEAADQAAELGYVAPEQDAGKPRKPDYSQANPDVMNGGGKG